jgi:LEA14-like dessication related protein
VRRFLLAVPLLLLMGTTPQYQGCGCIQRRIAIQSCVFSLESVEVSGLGLDGVHFKVRVGVENPNEIETVLDAFDFRFFLNGSRLVSGRAEKELVVPPGDKRPLHLKLLVGYSAAHRFYKDLKRKTLKTYRFEGQAHLDSAVGLFTFPVEMEGRF